MALEEQETVMVANRSDMQAGFFRFSTTRESDYRKLIKKIGGEDKLFSVQKQMLSGKVTAWNCRVPVTFLSKTNFGIRKPGIGRGNPENFYKKKRQTV